MKRIGIFGTSGMARETRDIAHALGYDAVFVARSAAERAAFSDSGDVILESDVGSYKDMPYVIGVGEGALRAKIAVRHANIIRFGNLIHPSATFGCGQRQHIETRSGVIVCAGVRFTSNISVGDFTLFNLNATISHDSVIADYVTVSPNACILGNVSIGEAAWIGAGTIVNQGSNDRKVTIGKNTLIGSGAVIIADCDADSVYVGVPGRKIK
ncbi:sugar O-acyltransferase (sialic acid O-acetyltransferase NeuD family) [Vogesella indigofera]|uniref:Sugar O-acyltransferase (Sialic acid O-acetyltransferase NeuD family) n=1 Tax=Vogesella indigofera TaxID=45465 RepID=A0A495BGA6_VOGIN|nr:acetyltransferase [Vogesella indigofera]RKQ58715.1 sugar O-acyltransferase (sialic acid O-acetyltransferase NeuD family) [Vogesella indigofera]